MIQKFQVELWEQENPHWQKNILPKHNKKGVEGQWYIIYLWKASRYSH